ncbi:sensor histidine kinase [Halorarum salinum]|uniref:histidine kinase n=1 Tax=Halorarum salinum TaxID=2743089 RepID=A0A7D5L991_9EURY|nr:ATP-binding protein [Halobaculum salinum]QLG61326.1 histidine kinase [Halobaculum salinum]
MPRWSRRLSWLGLLIVAVAAGHTIERIVREGAMVEPFVEFALIGFSGVLVLSVGRWLSHSEIDPEFYPRIVFWCLGGVGVLFVFLVLRSVHPGVSNPFTYWLRAIALALGSIAGLGIGVHDARAATREREVTRRNEELTATRTELERAIQQVEASNERLEQFAYAASHDLREPLRMVSSYLQLIEGRYGDELDEDGREFVGFAVDGADRMRNMIDGLLAYSRVETKGNPFEPVDLEAVLEDALADLQVMIEERDAEITAGPLPRVRGDATQLRQLLQNLLSNAIEYSDERPRVDVSAERQGSEWEISVRDEGIGIDPADQTRIFEIFRRLHAVDEYSGSGIGLALCQRIVERHGGRIRVESTPGDGSTFSFTVPACGNGPVDADAGSSS